METLIDDCLDMVFDYLTILDRLQVENGMYLKKYINLKSYENLHQRYTYKSIEILTSFRDTF